MNSWKANEKSLVINGDSYYEENLENHAKTLLIIVIILAVLAGVDMLT